MIRSQYLDWGLAGEKTPLRFHEQLLHLFINRHLLSLVDIVVFLPKTLSPIFPCQQNLDFVQAAMCLAPVLFPFDNDQSRSGAALANEVKVMSAGNSGKLFLPGKIEQPFSCEPSCLVHCLRRVRRM